jgi:hypothetical protein
MVLAAAAGALLLASAATATEPSSTIVNVDVTFTNTLDCPFPLIETVSGSYKDTVYYDAAGNPVKEILTAQYGGALTVTWTNPVSGATLTSFEAAPHYNPDGSFQSLQNVGLISTSRFRGRGRCCSTLGGS